VSTSFHPQAPPVEAGEAFAFPLTFQQQRLWFLEQFDPGTPLYHIPSPLKVSGALDADVLERALEAVVARHEALRTVFRAVGGEPVQVVGACAPVRLEVADLRALPAEEREAEAKRRVQEAAHRPFDLERGPLLRLLLVRLAGDEQVLLPVMHHIVGDGWSMGVFARELWALYDAFRAGRPDPLPPLPLQYADVAVWQRDWMAGETLEAELAWWTGRLAGAPPALDLPADRPRPARQSHEGAVVSRALPPALVRALHEVARREGATLYMVLLAALDVLLARYTGAEDVVVGTPIANRTDPDVEGLIGLFANTLVVRADLSGNPTFGEVVGRLREATLAAHEHQDVPFEKVVEALGVERSLSRTPLFQVFFILQNAGSAHAESAPGIRVASMGMEGQTAKFDLTVGVRERPDGSLMMALEYPTALFDVATMVRRAEHLATLLAAAAAAPDARIHDLALMPAYERRRVVEEWNATARELPSALVHEMVAARAAATPDAMAVVGRDGTLTYGELEALSNRLARHLRSLGAGPGVLVAVAVERGAAMVAALLGVLKSGAAYLPVDPDYPSGRVEYMLADSGARLLLTQQRLASVLPRGGAGVVLLDPGQPWSAEHSAAPLEPAAGPDDLAYVIYTSGSTGRPKGVQVRHGGVAAFLQAMSEAPGIAPEDVLLAVTTLSFDIAVLELFLPLTAGARVVVAGRDEAADPALLRDAMERTRATVMQATPATWRMLAAGGWTPPSRMKLLSGGEALPRELADALLAGGAELWNLYGPTETTVWSTATRIEPGAPVTVGRPIANTRVYVLDGYGNPTPVGVPGELVIGGAGVALGYLGRAELTAERFVPDPFGADPQGRMYRTGDRARWRADGTLELLGRLDTQVKVRGFRIELGEIESVLREHPAVADAAAAVREDTPGDARLVAYLVAAEGAALPLGELRGALRSRLPEYMVPGAFVTLDALPLTPNGKVDRKRLPAPDALAAEEAVYVAPATPTEEALAAIWGELLGRPRVGTAESFFDLGGHSLTATQVMARIRAGLGVALPVRVIFEARTVAELAKRVDEAKGAPQAQNRGIRAASRAAFRVALPAMEPALEPAAPAE
jgi:amino acid adenylation domain-containing protein